MKKAALLYNPLSGQRRARHLKDIRVAADVLREAGIEVTTMPTRAAPGTADQAREAIAQGCDTVFACGGDGTVHDVLQGLVGTGAALGVIPLGTANALAHDLRIPLSAAAAARASLTAKPRRIAVGRATYQDLAGQPACRYFAVTLGAGVDAHLFHELDVSMKVRLGMLAYYLKATWLWLTHSMHRFAVEFRTPDGTLRGMEVSELLAIRISNFGGVLRELAPGASLDRNDFRLVLFRTRSRIKYLGYIVRGLVGARWRIGGIELAHSTRVVCKPLAGHWPTYLEADGEILGTLPAEINLVPDALTLLVPGDWNPPAR
jgi:diacylglycerol kinase (ATP)